MKTAVCTIFLALAGSNFATPQKPPAPTYSVVDTFKIGGEGGWDCLTVDSASHRLFISRSTHVMVMDTESGKILADIPDTQGVHGVAVVPQLNKAFTSNGRDDSVSVIDLKTYKETSRIKVGKNPDVIMYDSTSNRVFTFNGGTSDTTAIDPATNSVAGTLKLDGKPEFAASDGAGSIFVNLEDKSEVQQFDAKTLKSVKTWPLAPGDGPTGIAIDTKRHHLFSACSNHKLVMSDYSNAKVVGEANIGNGPDGAAFDSNMNLAFTPNGQDGTLSVVDSMVTVQTVTTKKSARTMALDQKTHKIYLIAADFEAPAAGQRRGKVIPSSVAIIVVGPSK